MALAALASRGWIASRRTAAKKTERSAGAGVRDSAGRSGPNAISILIAFPHGPADRQAVCGGAGDGQGLSLHPARADRLLEVVLPVSYRGWFWGPWTLGHGDRLECFCRQVSSTLYVLPYQPACTIWCFLVVLNPCWWIDHVPARAHSASVRPWHTGLCLATSLWPEGPRGAMDHSPPGPPDGLSQERKHLTK